MNLYGLEITPMALCCVLLSALSMAWLVRTSLDPSTELGERCQLWVKEEALRLEHQLVFLRTQWTGERILKAQATVLLLAVLVLFFEPIAGAVLGLLILATKLTLKWAHWRRVMALEPQIEGWMGSLARALEAAPSLGDAIDATITASRAPLSEELELVVREMKLGLSLERALEAWERRVQSQLLSLCLTTIQIGRRTGGSLPKVLSESAATLREMERLRGVVRTKTAEGRAQSMVIGGMPFLLYFGLRWNDPLYFDPLMNTAMGNVLVAIAVLCWLAALFCAKKILAVRI